MKERPFDVIFCDDTKPIEKFNLTPEQQIKVKKSIESLRKEFFSQKDFRASNNGVKKIAV